MVRHLVLNTIKTYVHKFRGEYGNDVIIACDSRNYWRREQFPYYKAKRKELREKTTIDWEPIYEEFTAVKAELKEFFPYRVIEVDTAEADDIIGTLCHKFGLSFGRAEPIMIVSGDGDFAQLQIYGNVKQYSPVQKKFIKHNNPQKYLLEHIVRGDRGDGIPNYLSDDDTLVNPDKRSKKMYETKMDQYLDDLENPSDTNQRNINRNTMLIDLSKVPTKIKSQVIEQYEEQGGKTRMHLFNYFIDKGLSKLLDDINMF